MDDQNQTEDADLDNQGILPGSYLAGDMFFNHFYVFATVYSHQGAVDILECEEDEYYDDFEEVSERISMAEDSNAAAEILGGAHAGDVDVEESAFGRKIRKRKKKMETRLLKEILNDVKVSSKRH